MSAKLNIAYCLEKFITNFDKGLQKIATGHFITSCTKVLLQIATGSLLQVATSFITSCDRYYKLRLPFATVQPPPGGGRGRCGQVTARV